MTCINYVVLAQNGLYFESCIKYNGLMFEWVFSVQKVWSSLHKVGWEMLIYSMLFQVSFFHVNVHRMESVLEAVC
jgi:hypothetical protein